MKRILKTVSPQAFEEWKTKKKLRAVDIASKKQPEPKEYWEKFRKSGVIRADLEKQLIEEQGFICCYCQIGLEGNSHKYEHSTIVFEHIFPKSIYPARIFDYDNLLLSCDGGKSSGIDIGYETRPKWCDYHKNDSLISITPLDADCERYFQYNIIDLGASKLKIYLSSEDENANKTIAVLNLNVEQLQNRRGEYIAGIILEQNGDYISREIAQQLLDEYQGKMLSLPLPPFYLGLIKILQMLAT
jgi:uncharacterized protein (TIGR02646 family)